MDDTTAARIAFENLPSAICPLTGKPIQDPVVMHKDLSDWWPTSLHDMRDDRIANLLIVERAARDQHYEKLRQLKVVLAYSGGLDSTTVLHWCLRVFGSVHCLLFDYGQRHRVELERAENYMTNLAVETGSHDMCNPNISWDIVDMGCINYMAKSSLTCETISVPRNQSVDEIDEGIPNTFVPGRNIYFVTALAQAAYQLSSRHISLGVNVLDYSGYPDCRPEFLNAMRDAIGVGIYNGTGADVGIHAPLMFLNKTQIIRLGRVLGVKYEDTHSCYNGVLGGCGECDSCLLRRKAFHDLGIEDPAVEKHHTE